MIKINQALFMDSIEEVSNLYNMSNKLHGLDVQYATRRPSYLPLIGEEGHTSFHPVVTVDLVPTFKELLSPHRDEYYRQYQQADGMEEEKEAGGMYRIVGDLMDYITNEEIVGNIIPKPVREFIEYRKIKGFSSPKLSKMLVKLCGESSPAVAWYTNKCPKHITKGENKDYKLHISVLPHHIAGMSNYSCYNFEGKKWNGWEGTSCQDTARNSDGMAMYQLPASVKDESLAIAYLSKTENDDIMHPIMEARALIRVVEMKNGNVFYVVMRQFGYPESIHIINEGLVNRFDNVILNTTVREYSGKGGNLKFTLHIDDCRNTVYERCNECNGDGHSAWEEDDTCYECSGTGRVVERHYLPYIDDTDIIIVESEGTTARYTIPKQLLIDKGLYEDKKQEDIA